MQPTPQNNQLMSKHRVLSLKPQLRLEWRGQDGQSETEQPDHSASLGDSIRSSTRIRFSVHNSRKIVCFIQPQAYLQDSVERRRASALTVINGPGPAFLSDVTGGGKRRPARPDIDYFHLLVPVRIFLHVGSLTTMLPPFGDRPATGHFTGLLWQWLSINSVHRQIARADSSE
jgi:hypothetical protein